MKPRTFHYAIAIGDMEGKVIHEVAGETVELFLNRTS